MQLLLPPPSARISATPVAPATDDDFTLSDNRTLSFAANATGSTGTVRISPVGDSDPEPHDVVTVSGVVSNAAIQNPDDVTLTINDDTEAFDVAVSAPAAVDEDAGTATVTYTLTTRQNSAPVIDATMFYRQDREETATHGDDYTPPPGCVGFGQSAILATVPPSAFSPNAAGTAWVAEGSFAIGLVDDEETEPDETIVFSVATSSYWSPEQTIVIRDNDTTIRGNPSVGPERGACCWRRGARSRSGPASRLARRASPAAPLAAQPTLLGVCTVLRRRLLGGSAGFEERRKYPTGVTATDAARPHTLGSSHDLRR